MNINVLHIATDACGGAGNATLRIHQSLLDRGINSKVLIRDFKQYEGIELAIPQKNHTFGYFTKFGRFVCRVLHRLGVYVSKRDYLLEKRKTVARDICFTLPISEYALHLHPLIEWADIIHLHWVQDFVDFPTFFKYVHKPILWTCHDLNPIMGGFHQLRLRKKYRNVYGEIERICYDLKRDSLRKSVNLNLVALSTEMHYLLENHEFFFQRNIYDVPNCVDTSIFTIGDRASIRKEYEIPSDTYLLLFANGNLNDTEKGLKELIEALEVINDSKICLLCVGNGVIPSTSIAVKHVPRVNGAENMAKIYKMADMLVMPSHQEAFALTPLEAMSCGLPVVITPVSGAKDLVRDFNGEIACDFTPQSLSIAIRKALDKTLDKTYDPHIIRKYILDNYTPIIIGEKYVEIYHEMLK